MKVIGLIGRIGSGKHEVARYLSERHGIPVFPMSEPVRELARKGGIRPTRANLYLLSESLIQDHGNAFFANAVIGRIEESNANAALVLGIRTLVDAKQLYSHFGRNFVLVCVDGTNPGSRLERLRKTRKSEKYDAFERFRHDEIEEEEWFHLDATIRRSDVRLDNSGTLEDLHHAIEQSIVKPYLSEHIGK